MRLELGVDRLDDGLKVGRRRLGHGGSPPPAG
jgi:hypothetical protein